MPWYAEIWVCMPTAETVPWARVQRLRSDQNDSNMCWLLLSDEWFETTDGMEEWIDYALTRRDLPSAYDWMWIGMPVRERESGMWGSLRD